MVNARRYRGPKLDNVKYATEPVMMDPRSGVENE